MAKPTTPTRAQRAAPGIRVRHARGCPSASGGACRCNPSFEAWVYSKRDGKKLRQTFSNVAAAKSWRADAIGAVRRGTLKAAPSVTLREAAEAWLAGAHDGTIRNRSGDVYKPSVLRGYEQSLRARILPDLGAAKLGETRRADAQDLADRMLAKGADPSTIRNALMPLRSIYRRAVSRGDVAVNPMTGLELPAVRGRRERIASPAEAAELLAALPEGDRALWATAMYAGLRLGEIRALTWADVNFVVGVIRVERALDARGPTIEPKSRAGRRTVPIASVLRAILMEHRLRSGRSEGLVFGRSATQPFNPSSVWLRAASAWKRANAMRATENEERAPDEQLAPLEPIGLHECRHTFASLMIAAGVNAKALSTYMGHSSVTITLDRYGHLMPGNEEEAAGLLDRYLAEAAGSAASTRVG